MAINLHFRSVTKSDSIQLRLNLTCILLKRLSQCLDDTQKHSLYISMKNVLGYFIASSKYISICKI